MASLLCFESSRMMTVNNNWNVGGLIAFCMFYFRYILMTASIDLEFKCVFLEQDLWLNVET